MGRGWAVELGIWWLTTQRHHSAVYGAEREGSGAQDWSSGSSDSDESGDSGARVGPSMHDDWSSSSDDDTAGGERNSRVSAQERMQKASAVRQVLALKSMAALREDLHGPPRERIMEVGTGFHHVRRAMLRKPTILRFRDQTVPGPRTLGIERTENMDHDERAARWGRALERAGGAPCCFP